MTLIINESNKGTAPKVSSSSPLDCKLAQSSVYRKAKDLIQITRGRAIKLDISFHRTLRVPDGKGDSELPPSMGTFPLYSVANYTKRLPKDMAAKGGLFLPMYRMSTLPSSFLNLSDIVQSVKQCGFPSKQKSHLLYRFLLEA